MERPPLSAHGPFFLAARELAGALAAGPWREGDLLARGRAVVPTPRRWLRPTVRRMLAALGEGARPSPDRLAAFLRDDPGFRLAFRDRAKTLKPAAVGATRPAFWPAAGPPLSWALPPLATPGELADWLGLTPNQLDAFADPRGFGARGDRGRLGHYVYTWRAKADGSARLIESPKPRLKAIQRRLLDDLLAAIPPHDAAHGFRRGRSVRTFAAPHAGRAMVLRVDLRDFFATVTAARVAAVWRTAGYPEPVARLLAGLGTNRVPTSVWNAPGLGAGPAATPADWRSRRKFAAPHLPQGAPTSPALANLAAYRLDARLSGLAEASGAVYTRYADDLAFSGGGDFARGVGRFVAAVAAVAIEEGFEVRHHKTRLMRQGTRQRLAGVVVNAHPNFARDEYDRLKATLHNCLTLGPDDQDRDRLGDLRDRLTGRVAHVAMLNPARGAKLRAVLDQIAW